MRLAAVRLRAADPVGLARFYTERLGMTARRDGAGVWLGYGGQDARLCLLPGGFAQGHRDDTRYWKIGITVPNVDLAATALRAAGLTVRQPRQVGQIGYLCHLTDPEGFVIELLQHDFEGNRPEGAGDPDAPFAEARIGQITLRTGNIAAEHEICTQLGMRLLSVQDLGPDLFDLHFYAFTDDVPPVPDVTAVANREWLWKRPYTTLEFQHVRGARFGRARDYHGLVIEGLAQPRADAAGDPLVPA